MRSLAFPAVAAVTLAGALAFLSTVRAGDSAAVAETSSWQSYEYTFQFLGFTSTYSCDGLAGQLRKLLAALAEVMWKAGVELDNSPGRVMYARSYAFRGHTVPHLVVSTAQGPVIVLVLRHESVVSQRAFHEVGMTGVIAPAPHGGLAVLWQGSEHLDEVVEQILRSVRWLPGDGRSGLQQ